MITSHIMFVLVLWARVCHICSRMHIHTRAYVTKKKPHVHACRHMCHSSCPTAPIDIRPRQLTNPEPHTGFLRALPSPHLARASSMARRWAWGHAAVQLAYSSPAVAGPGLCQRRPRSNTGPAGKGTTSTNTGQGQQGDSQGNKAPSLQERRQRRTVAVAVQARPGAMHSSRATQREPQPRGNRAVLVCL